jgi:hypothetical protein
MTALETYRALPPFILTSETTSERIEARIAVIDPLITSLLIAAGGPGEPRRDAAEALNRELSSLRREIRTRERAARRT